MPLKDPARYRDKTLDWMAFFAQARRAALRPLITPALIAEHAEDPRGQDTPHSQALQDVLNYLHNMPTDGKSFAYAEAPGNCYRVGVMQARGHGPVFPDDKTHDTERAAVHAVFLQRLRALGLMDSGEVA